MNIHNIVSIIIAKSDTVSYQCSYIFLMIKSYVNLISYADFIYVIILFI